ncbi:hypothetical protein [Flavobacterium cerinum]|uniref:Uncharacterized protein n=1 Tax=Flavobacterium cerinum TaxID=2502784 RepID=A0A444HFN6_9FLAO|nr:hypothetical protein [Flavobacterium cerinum]RWX03700.1 hypothetical protein EPI11_01870 [Flavobacterium cerinum]
MKIVNEESILHDKFVEFKSGLLDIQKENHDVLQGTKLAQECSPYISIHVSGINYRKEIPIMIRKKIEILLSKIFK